ncbi:nicotinamide n-methyltransferase [Lignoscripta atroalba]|nr:nicotinamide n-methyltransferase [Lignoscripta atroalba]
MASDDDEDLAHSTIFQEPEGYFKPEKASTYAEYTMLSGQILRLRLVGHSPLWGHLLWNAGQVVSEYLQQHAPALVQGKDVLELGAGAGLPSIVCAIMGAKKVDGIVVTDYPDADLIENLTYNIKKCEPVWKVGPDISAEGYLWGAPTSSLLSAKFDLLILADILFNHSEHGKLVATLRATLRHGPTSRALVFFTPYRPWLLEKDMAFFDVAVQEGFEIEKIMEKVMDKVMFAEDRGVSALLQTLPSL